MMRNENLANPVEGRKTLAIISARDKCSLTGAKDGRTRVLSFCFVIYRWILYNGTMRTCFIVKIW